MTNSKLNRIPVYFSDEALQTLAVIQDSHGEHSLSLSGAVNLVAQLAYIIARIPLPLTTGELLYCCDILNPGASMTEFKTPDAVSIRQALEGMKHSLQDGLDEPGILEKWDINGQALMTKLELMEEPALFALAFASRQFWSGKPLGNVKALADCNGYAEWAAQWVEEA